MTERPQGARADVLYNACVLVGPDGYIGHCRKVHQPLTERLAYAPGDGWSVFETELGRIGLMICYDKNFPEAARELVLGGADLLVAIPAWGLSRRAPTPLPTRTLPSTGSLTNARAAEDQVPLIAANQVGRREGADLDMCGGGRVVAPTGEVLAEMGYEEGMIVATIAPRADTLHTRTIFAPGLTYLRDRRPDTYVRARQGGV